jgi:DNA-directed RNA polymerase beta' subunit
MKNRKLRFERNLRIFAGLVLLFLTVLCYATDIGTGIGVTTAIAGIVGVPQLTEKETQFADHVKGEVSRELEKFSKCYMSETKLNEILSQKMAGWMDKKPEMLDELKSALETQGLEIIAAQNRRHSANH